MAITTFNTYHSLSVWTGCGFLSASQREPENGGGIAGADRHRLLAGRSTLPSPAPPPRLKEIPSLFESEVFDKSL